MLLLTSLEKPLSLYVLAASPVVLMLTVITSVSVVVVPEVGLRLSHAALSPALQFNVPPSGLAILNICADGFAAASSPENVRLG